MEKKIAVKYKRRIEQIFPLEALGKHAVESLCLLLALCFQCFFIFLNLI